MGAWGTGPFDNDDAADWSADLENADDPAHLIEETLALAVAATDHLQVDVANQAVGAAAALASGLAAGLDVDPSYGPQDITVSPTPELASLAVRALDRVTARDSEWRELWEESDESAAALASVARIRTALEGVGQESGPER
ncbi:MAG: DUF4259 domain-containing protein [Nocardioides sp.]